jgi:DNA-binding PadR family transcriptional regulator
MRLREATFHILTALARGRRHGYGIITDVAGQSEGRVKLQAGTLYAALDRLCADGLVAQAGEEVVDGRLRRYYALTSSGAGRLAEETELLLRDAAVAQRNLEARERLADGRKGSIEHFGSGRSLGWSPA